MRKNSTVKGICFVSAGVLIAGIALGWFNASLLVNGWWALLLIIPFGARILFEGINTGAMLAVSAGIMLFMQGIGAVSYTAIIKLSLPIFLVSWGISMIYKSIVPYNQDASLKSKIIRCITGGTISIIYFAAIIALLLFIDKKSETGIDNESGTYSSFYEEFNNIDKLMIETGSAELVITTGSELSVSSSNLHSSYKIFSENGTLYIEKDFSLTIEELFSFGWMDESEKSKLIVTIPEGGNFKEVEINGGSSKIYAEGIITDELKADFSSGAVIMSDCSAAKADINTASGACNFDKFKSEDINADSGSGKITFAKSELRNLDLSSASGMVYIEGILTGSSHIDSGSGGVVLVITGSLEDYYINGSAGSGGIWINGTKEDDFSIGDKSLPNSFRIDGGSGRVSIDISM